MRRRISQIVNDRLFSNQKKRTMKKKSQKPRFERNRRSNTGAFVTVSVFYGRRAGGSLKKSVRRKKKQKGEKTPVKKNESGI